MTNQNDLLDRAKNVLPGGGFGNFDPGVIIREGKGSHVWDIDGNEFIDYLIGSGPMLLGHCHPEVVEAVREQVSRGMTFFASNDKGIELAEAIVEAVPCAEQVRYNVSGTEADMYAIRLARAATGRDKIIKFEGGYHGMSPEAQMSLAPAKLVNFPMAVPDSAGIPSTVGDDMLIAPYNDIDFVRSLLAEYEGQVAGVIVEPLQRVIEPKEGFLRQLRDEATKHGAVLIFDEVVTGFRLAYGGAQEYYGVTPDLCTLGKIIGGGFPLAAVAGKAEIMRHFDRAKVGADKALMQIGTLSGAPVASVAGLKTMEILRRPGAYEKLRANGRRVWDATTRHLTDAGHAHRMTGDVTCFDVIFTDRPIINYRDMTTGDAGKTARFNEVLRAKGLLKAPAKTYISAALTDADLEHTEAAVADAAKAL